MLQLGRQGQLYGIEEVTYGTIPAIAASNAVRHRNFTLTFDNKNKRSTNEKRQSPFENVSMRSDTRKTGEYSYEGLLRPSGTLNTLPEVDFMLKAGFGARTNVTLSTTVSVGTGAVSGATLASTTGLAVKDFVLITCPDGKKRLRQILTLPGGGVVTWAPNLPSGQQPADGAAVKGCVTYKTISAGLPSLSFAHYLKKTDGSAGLMRAAKGCAPNVLALLLDANDDVRIQLSGPCKEVVDPPSQPGGFTMVGSTPASIQTGETFIGNTAIKFLTMQFTLNNGLWLRMDEYGETAATEMIRREPPTLTVQLNTRAEDEATLYDLTEAGTNAAVFQQTDFTEGRCIAVRAPQVEFKPPSTDDPMQEVKWDYSGMGLESADGALDAIYVALG
jgi:hypothetical protein